MLNSPELRHDLFSRLPYRIKSQFVSFGGEGEFNSFRVLRTLIEKAAEEADSEYERLLYKTRVSNVNVSKIRETQGKGQRVCVAQQSLTGPVSQTRGYQCECCGGSHKLWKCSEYKEKPVEDRKLLVKQKGLCFNCFLSGHQVSQCRVKLTCRTCG